MPLLDVVVLPQNLGVCPALCAAILICQMCPAIVMTLLGARSVITSRSSGGLTGSRLAGVAGHVIVLGVVCRRFRVWESNAFKIGLNSMLAVATWVDNIFAYSCSVRGALEILRDFEEQLCSVWGLAIKESSRKVLVCKGGDCSAIPEIWRSLASMNVLGHYIQNDGGARSEWLKIKPALWGIFWRNCGARVW